MKGAIEWFNKFSSLFREFISLIETNKHNTHRLVREQFSSLFREFISLMKKKRICIWQISKSVFVPFQGIHFFNKKHYDYKQNVKDLFSSLFREFISLIRVDYYYNGVKEVVFVPFQGIHFFNF